MRDEGRWIKLDLVDEDLGWMERRTRQHLKIGKGAPVIKLDACWQILFDIYLQAFSASNNQIKCGPLLRHFWNHVAMLRGQLLLLTPQDKASLSIRFLLLDFENVLREAEGVYAQLWPFFHNTLTSSMTLTKHSRLYDSVSPSLHRENQIVLRTE